MTQGLERTKLSAADVFSMAVEAERAGNGDRADQLFVLLGANLEAAGAELARSHETAGRFDQAEAIWRTLMRLRPEDTRIQCELGRHLLREGNFTEGFALMEARDVELSRGVRGRPRLSFPPWRGEPVGSLLVFGEQGLGDQIQFARFVPELIARGIDVTLVCGPPLVQLFEPLGARLVPTLAGQPIPKCDAWALSLSLPLLLGTTLETIPSAPYLPGRSGGSGIGVATRGNPQHANDHNRSLPADAAAALMSLPGAVSLHQEDIGSAEFATTADIIRGLELVVSVDTAVAHLAGAMGKPCILLLPFVPDWRWLRERADTPWYPSMTLYRQPAPGDWTTVIERVRLAVPTR